MLLIVFLVVIAPLGFGVHTYHVPHVDLDTVSGGSVRDSLQLLAIFLLNMRPHHVLGGIAEERPVFLVVVLGFEDDDLEHVIDFWRQQVPVLKSDLMGRALQMHVGPAIFYGEAESALQFGKWGVLGR